jgi:hypothetical protein
VQRGRFRRLPAVATALVTVVVVLGATLLLRHFGDDRADKAPVVANLPRTPEEVYVRVGRALDRPGFVYHDTVTTEYDYPPLLKSWEGESRFERWVDAGRDLAREERRYPRGSGVWRAITAGGGRYIQTSRGIPNVAEAERCRGGSPTTSTVLDCTRQIDKKSMRVEAGEYEGKAAVVLVQNGTSYGSDETVRYTERLYLDPNTYLPIAKLMEGEMDYGEVAKLSARSTYSHEFIPADSLPAAFFDPRSFGAGRLPSTRPLDRDWGIPAYWLGARYPGAGKLPPLEISAINTRSEMYEYFIDYRVANSLTPMTVRVEVFDTAKWNPGWFSMLLRQPCVKRTEVTLPGGRAVIYSRHESEDGAPARPTPAGNADPCAGRPLNSHSAHVLLGKTNVVIDTVGNDLMDARGLVNSYNSVEGMEVLARALRVREPSR